jgi:sugar O-acyltransferase (sialic acid O-acetyltransferase NeuD family)
MRLVIFGTGGMGREALRHARLTYSEIVFARDKPSGPVLGTPVIAPNEMRNDDELLVAIGNSATRRKIIARFPHLKLASVFAATSIIGDDVEIGAGALFCDYTLVTACARIGSNFQCNVYSYVAHDCVIGDDVTFGPRVCCNGNVHICSGAHLGAGANLRNGRPDKPLVIGEGAFVCMGAVVTKDVPPATRVFGNPAKPMMRN